MKNEPKYNLTTTNKFDRWWCWSIHVVSDVECLVPTLIRIGHNSLCTKWRGYDLTKINLDS